MILQPNSKTNYIDLVLPAQDKIMNCLIYLRVSSEEQVTNYSLDTQYDICAKFAEGRGLTVLQTFREEGQSAKTANRTELINLLEFARQNKDKIKAVIAYRIDRWSRNTMDYLAIKKKLYDLGIELLSATEPTGESPTEKFIETLLAANAELDNEIRGEKARNGLKKRFLAGLPPSNPPVGYKYKGRKVIPDPRSFDKIRQAFELMATGTKTLSEMAKEINTWNMHKRFKKQGLGRIFRNKFYIGILTSERYPGEESKGKHRKLVSNSIFYRVQDVLSGRRVNFVKGSVVNENFPLRGLISCTCGRKLVGAICKKKYYKYWCNNPDCKGTYSRELINQKLFKLLKDIKPSEEAINLFTLILHSEYNNRLELLKTQKATGQKELQELKDMMKLLVQGHLKGMYPDDIYMEEKERISDKILATEIVMNDGLMEKYDIESICSFVKAIFKDLVKAYEVSDYGQKRILISSIFPSGLVFKDNGLLNSDISPVFRDIQAFSKPASRQVGLTVPRLNQFFLYLNELSKAYPNYPTQFYYV